MASLLKERLDTEWQAKMGHRGAQHTDDVLPVYTDNLTTDVRHLEKIQINLLQSLNQYELAVLVAVERSSYWNQVSSYPHLYGEYRRPTSATYLQRELDYWWTGPRADLKKTLQSLCHKKLVRRRSLFNPNWETTREGQIIAAHINIYENHNDKARVNPNWEF